MALPEDKIAIEINGPHHYSDQDSLLGDFRLKKYILERLGWKVISIPYWHFENFEQKHYQAVKKEIENIVRQG